MEGQLAAAADGDDGAGDAACIDLAVQPGGDAAEPVAREAGILRPCGAGERAGITGGGGADECGGGGPGGEREGGATFDHGELGFLGPLLAASFTPVP